MVLDFLEELLPIGSSGVIRRIWYPAWSDSFAKDLLLAPMDLMLVARKIHFS
jgi:hypothetical protein